jgi:hypothetical protein
MKCTYSFDQLHLLGEERFPDSQGLLKKRVAVGAVAAIAGKFWCRYRGVDVVDLVTGRKGAVEWNMQNASPSLMPVRNNL